jgi:hypothetical protein
LKIQFGELAHLAFLINFCPKIAIISKTKPSQNAYANKLSRPVRKLSGNITAKIIA